MLVSALAEEEPRAWISTSDPAVTATMQTAKRGPRRTAIDRASQVAVTAVLLAVWVFTSTALPLERVRPLPAGWPHPLPSALANPVDAGIPAFRRFTSRDGLPQNAILAVAADESGLVWVGTKDGAAVYDGRSWRVVPMPPGCPSNYVTCILPADSSDVWFGTGGGGVARRRPDSTWQTFGEADGLPSSRIRTIERIVGADGRATIWAGTEGGLAVLSGDRWSKVDLPEPYASMACTALGAFSRDGAEPEIWMSADGTPLRWLDGVWTVERAGLETITTPSSVVAFAETRSVDGVPTVVAGHSEGVSRFVNGRWTPLPLPAGSDYFNVGLFNVTNCVDSTDVDGVQSLWAAAAGGVFRYTVGQWTRFGPDQGFPVQPQTLLVSGDSRASHALWIGTNGVGLHRLQFGLWSSIRVERPDKPFSVYSIAVTTKPGSPDVAWIGTVSSGVLRLEDGRRTWPLAGTRYDATWVRCIAQDPVEGPDTMWLGCGFGSLLRIRNGRVEEVAALQRGGNANVNALHWSSLPDGIERLWIASDLGVHRIHNDQLLEAPVGLDLVDERSTSMLETTDDAGKRVLFVGTEDGLAMYDGTGTRTLTTADGLPSAAIMSLREIRSRSGERELWIGTRAGAARLSLDVPAKPMATLTVSTLPALPNNTVYRIESDAAGRVYLFTNKGIARFNLSDDSTSGDSIFVFTSEDGLPSDECNTGGSLVDANGRIWAGTLEGAAVLDPAREVQSRDAGSVRILRQIVATDEERPLQPSESLAYESNRVAFEFAMVNHHREESTEYRTQLAGFEDAPSSWSTEFKREYISLPAGDYEFKVWGRDVFGNVAGPVSIPFSVLQPPWLSWWAFLVYVIALAGLIYSIVQYRHRALRRRNESLAVAIAERTAELAHHVAELRLSRRIAVESEQSAREANLAKSVFLANMSHELRTPLNAVLGFSQLLDRSEVLGSTERHQLSVIRRSGEHLLGLINDVLSIAKIEAGRLELNIHPFHVADMLSGIEAMTRNRAEAKDLQLVVDIADGFPQVVSGDDGKLRQVLLNLLGNAVKFTDSGEVRLSASWTNGRASFVVSDTGRGIDAKELERVFEAFAQSESGRDAPDGTGLGLTISRQIVQLMGGVISVESEPSVGSSFAFSVELPACTDLVTGTRRQRVLRVSDTERRRRVLIADDNAANRLLLSTFLAEVGFEVREASNGREAIEAVVDWSPRVIFMDQRMPVMDGAEATREVRRLEAESLLPRCVIIATTASVFEQDRDAILADGSNDVVTKPFSENEIFDAMARHAFIRFDMIDDAESNAPSQQSEPFSRSALRGFAKIPEHVMADFLAALRVGDAIEAERVAESIAAIDAELHTELVRRLRAFELDIVQAAIEAELIGQNAGPS